MCWLKTSSILFTTNFFLDAFHLSKNNEDGSCQLRMGGQVPNSKHVFHGTNELKNMIPPGKYAQVPQGNMVA
jgi:hypothetical protein